MRLFSFLIILILSTKSVGAVLTFSVIDLDFTGPVQGPTDAPSVDIDFWADFAHESGEILRFHGFWDGDGAGGVEGNVFLIRFCPSLPGTWTIADVYSNVPELNDLREGETFAVEESGGSGFWLVDDESDGRWFKRSDGSYPYIIGNTHYDFLGAPNGKEASRESIEFDISQNATYFKKLRFCVRGLRSENSSSEIKPFFRQDGRETKSETHRPNPKWYRERVDVAVQKGYELDLICDLILGGTTGDQVADSSGFLKYIAARYGSYPNVWITIGQEYNEQTNPAHEKEIGEQLRQWLPYPTPLSTHGTGSAEWDSDLNGDWCTHSIRQGKHPEHLRNLAVCSQAMIEDHNRNGSKPTVNDENAYDPNESTTLEALQAILGTFGGGGYGTVGHKLASKQGAYFWGYSAAGITADKHPSASHLTFLRDKINAYVHFWEMMPVAHNESIFENTKPSYSVLEWRDNQYVLLSDTKNDSLVINLPEGNWTVWLFDVVNEQVSRTIDYLGPEVVWPLPSQACLTFVQNNLLINVGHESATPADCALQQNYPNPFNPKTTISFSLPTEQRATLAIYNAVGRRVNTLVNGPRQTGTHSVNWDGLDSNGRPVCSGLYFCQLRTGNFVETRKMLLTR